MNGESPTLVAFGCGIIVGFLIGLLMMVAADPPKLVNEEQKIIRWKDQLYQMVPVEKKIEYVKPEEKE